MCILFRGCQMIRTDAGGAPQRHHPNRPSGTALHPAHASCSTHEPDPSQPPRVAHCVAGLVRSFAKPLVYKALRRNLIESFGGEPSLFLALKTFDVPSKDKKGHFNITVATDVSVDWTPERIEQQLRPAIEWLKPTVVQLHNSSDDTKALLNRKCPLALHRDIKAHPAHLSYATEAGMVRLVGQLRANAECLRMVEAHELQHGVCFDWVSRGRPDLLHLGSMPRYSVYNPDHSEDVYMDRRDWFVLTRRRNAKGALDSLDMYTRCNRTRSDLQTPEAWLRASIMERHGVWKPGNLPMGLAHPESCAKVCPPSARQERDAGGVPVFRVNKDSCQVASPEACVDDVPVTCRTMVCTLELAKLVGARRDAARAPPSAAPPSAAPPRVAPPMGDVAVPVRDGTGSAARVSQRVPAAPVVAAAQVRPSSSKREKHGGAPKEVQRRADTSGGTIGSKPSTADLVVLLVRRSPAVVVVIAFLVILVQLGLFLFFRVGRSLLRSWSRIDATKLPERGPGRRPASLLPRCVAVEGTRRTSTTCV